MKNKFENEKISSYDFNYIKNLNVELIKNIHNILNNNMNVNICNMWNDLNIEYLDFEMNNILDEELK